MTHEQEKIIAALVRRERAKTLACIILCVVITFFFVVYSPDIAKWIMK